MALKRIWLSVDWDFFQEERPEWDWGHSESNPMFSSLVWGTRLFAGSKDGPVDLRPFTDPDRYEPKAASLWDRTARWRFNCDEVAVADSHGRAYPFFHQLIRDSGSSPPDEIWNFDAHHDLGYHPLKVLRSWVKAEKVEAGSWLFGLLHEYKKLKCKFVHPVWKDPTIEARPWLKDKVAQRVTTVSAAAFNWQEPVEVTGLFIAKSESWSPPWNDKKFAAFVAAAEKRAGVPSYVYGDHDVREPRDWDENNARAMLTPSQMLKLAGGDK